MDPCAMERDEMSQQLLQIKVRIRRDLLLPEEVKTTLPASQPMEICEEQNVSTEDSAVVSAEQLTNSSSTNIKRSGENASLEEDRAYKIRKENDEGSVNYPDDKSPTDGSSKNFSENQSLMGVSDIKEINWYLFHLIRELLYRNPEGVDLKSMCSFLNEIDPTINAKDVEDLLKIFPLTFRRRIYQYCEEVNGEVIVKNNDNFVLKGIDNVNWYVFYSIKIFLCREEQADGADFETIYDFIHQKNPTLTAKDVADTMKMFPSIFKQETGANNNKYLLNDKDEIKWCHFHVIKEFLFRNPVGADAETIFKFLYQIDSAITAESAEHLMDMLPTIFKKEIYAHDYRYSLMCIEINWDLFTIIKEFLFDNCEAQDLQSIYSFVHKVDSTFVPEDVECTIKMFPLTFIQETATNDIKYRVNPLNHALLNFPLPVHLKKEEIGHKKLAESVMNLYKMACEKRIIFNEPKDSVDNIEHVMVCSTLTDSAS